ncbi:MAG: UPF0158 family protein [Gammaproteobacteria bacterium]
MAVNLDDLIMASDFVDFDDIETEAFLDKESGRIYYRSEEDFGIEEQEELPDDLDENDKYVAIPSKRHLDLGTNLVYEFIDQALSDKEAEQVRSIFRSRGAYRRFKDFLIDIDKIDQWRDFENQAHRDAILEWCEDNGIELAGS